MTSNFQSVKAFLIYLQYPLTHPKAKDTNKCLDNLVKERENLDKKNNNQAVLTQGWLGWWFSSYMSTVVVGEGITFAGDGHMVVGH